MPLTQDSDLAGTVYAKVIEPLIIAYQYDDVTAISWFRYASIEAEKTATAGFPRWVKNATAAVATEQTVIATTTLSTTNVDIAVSRVGIAREIGATAQEDSIIGNALYTERFVMDAAILFGESFDTDGTALFASLTAAQGTTSVALQLSVLVQAMGTQRANKAKGMQVIHMHDLQLKQLQVAQLAATATPWAIFFQPNPDGSSQFGGYFMNSPVWASSKNPTANAAADRVGAVFTNGRSDDGAPAFCPFAFVMKRKPSSLTLPDILQDGSLWASYCRYGVGIPANNFGTKFISQNS